MSTDKPIWGIALMIGFCFVAPMGDAVAKLLGERMPLGQLLFVRFAVQAVLLIPLVWLTGRAWRMQGFVLGMTVLRTILHILGIGAMFTALKYLPLADAVAIAFVMPFIMLLLGHFVLGEEVGHRRIWACAVGFIGTLMVVQPAFQEVGWPALLPLFVAVNFAVFMLITRTIAKQTDPIGLQAVSGIMAVVIMAPILWLARGSDIPALSLITPTQIDWVLLGAIGGLGTLAHLLMTWSLRYAPSATLAPLQYIELPIATVIGFLIFRDLPNALAAAGIVVIMISGLYIVFRERAVARAALSPDPEPTTDRAADPHKTQPPSAPGQPGAAPA